MWQETYVKWKNYWQSGTAEFTPISANLEKFAIMAIALKVYVDNDTLLILVVVPVLLLWNVFKTLAGWWRDRAMLWHYENEFINARNPTLKRIEKATAGEPDVYNGLKHWSQKEAKK